MLVKIQIQIKKKVKTINKKLTKLQKLKLLNIELQLLKIIHEIEEEVKVHNNNKLYYQF